ncbi:hypothetical protein LF1_33210 [Rubripirellula obstinata]|uniref:Uncharacterized protein n=1 Tax=Rubripirellula obstinata TaxID=406547 RepID=A0A5B1CMK3_9BACT|nr:hypothetical protein [Rubripirellula obstinata]KAA1260780.1 hypothetical protein LF1_33210 [Rubripirellula obstinata]
MHKHQPTPKTIQFAKATRPASMQVVLLICLSMVVGFTGCSDDTTDANTAGSSMQVTAPEIPMGPKPATVIEEEEPQLPWDYSPYRVLVWVASDDPSVKVSTVETELREYLDRDFSSIWRTTLADAPDAISAMMFRDLDGLDYDSLSSADPILAVKRDHENAIRIRSAPNVGEFVQQVLGTSTAIASLKQRGIESGKPELDGVAQRLKTFAGDSMDVAKQWAEPGTEAVLLSRGLAMTLTEPEAKLIPPPVENLVANQIEDYDKVFLVRVRSTDPQPSIDVVEIDVLIRFFGSVTRVSMTAGETISESIGQGLIQAFSPIVRIDNAGQKTAEGILRASGLIMDDKSPGKIQVGDVLMPATRKDDRNGNPFLIGPIDWAYLMCNEVEKDIVKMGFYAGRAGGLQGRKNNRTHRVAIKVKPQGDQTMLRLHAQGDPDFPLIGYEIYEKELDSKDMTFVGRTDWNGRMNIDKNEDPLRLMYVKNGGAVLARLPMVPGLDPKAVADIRSDDMRLEAESYIRGVQNSIIDLVAVRELFKARITMRLQNGEMEAAEELMDALRSQPSNEALANEMGKRQAAYLKILGNKQANQRRMVDQMFSTTRELLGKHINPKLVRDLESAMITARNNGGKLPAKPVDPEDED